MENQENQFNRQPETQSVGDAAVQPEENMEMREVNPHLDSKTGGIAYSAAVIIFFIVSILAGVIISVAKLEEYSNAYVYISYLASPVALAVCVFSVIKFRKVKFREIFPVKCKPKYYFIAVLLIFGMLFSLSWVNSIAVSIFEMFGYVPRESESYFPDLTGAMIIPALIGIAVLPALFEELLFRGVLLNCCEQSMGTVRAVLVVGFAFSLFHGSPEQTVYQFLCGCAFALLAVRSGSILPPILMHFINNALIVLMQAFGAFGADGDLLISPVVSLIIMALSVASLIGSFVWLMLDKQPLKQCKKGGVKTFFAWASVGIAILGIMWLLSLFGAA